MEDYGILAAILVREKNYIIILNRSKLIINDTNLYEQLDNLENDNSNNIKKLILYNTFYIILIFLLTIFDSYFRVFLLKKKASVLYVSF